MLGKKRKICIFKHILKMVSNICNCVAQSSRDPEATGMNQAGTQSCVIQKPEGHCGRSVIYNYPFQFPSAVECCKSMLGSMSINLPCPLITCRPAIGHCHKWATQLDRLLVQPTDGMKVEHILLERSKSTWERRCPHR